MSNSGQPDADHLSLVPQRCRFAYVEVLHVPVLFAAEIKDTEVTSCTSAASCHFDRSAYSGSPFEINFLC